MLEGSSPVIGVEPAKRQYQFHPVYHASDFVLQKGRRRRSHPSKVNRKASTGRRRGEPAAALWSQTQHRNEAFMPS